MFRRQAAPQDTPASGDPAAPLVLFTAPATEGIASVSPFDLKLQAWLRLAGISFKQQQGSPLRGPKGKVPFISHGTHLIGDSGLIITYLNNTYGPGTPGYSGPARVAWWSELDGVERARATAVTRLCEDSLYWALLWYRWQSDEGFQLTRKLVLEPDPVVSSIPWPVRGLVIRTARRGVKDNMRMQGIARHSEVDILGMAIRDVEALSDLLGDRPFFAGDKPSDGDCAVYGLLEQFVCTPWPSPIAEAVKTDARLAAFLARMRHAAFGSEAA